ncbi:DUF3800 domain-containing protein [Sulfitobacter sp. 1A12056]|uniref:DUF3800 domain-containing protein n=1 Tax=Sulfitobacter sp. 1A12056 TaxID=3368592 RepID=UPI0037452D18
MAQKLPLFDLYIDDSGTRHPDHAEPTSKSGDWFSLGGVLLKNEKDAQARKLHAEFMRKWKLEGPLHSVKIRHRSGIFSWLSNSTPAEVSEFFHDLDHLVTSFPGVGMACVIDRPGYHDRYYEKHGRQRWQLCKTAFTVICERAAKYAAQEGRRIRLFVEETDKKSDYLIREYFKGLKTEGMPFSPQSSEKYSPLSAEELNFRLLDLKFKRKSSPPMQMADLYLYPICRSGYDQKYRPFHLMKENQKVIDCLLSEEERLTLGIKFSCFPEKQKGPQKDP